MSCPSCPATRAQVLADLCASECPSCRTWFLPPDDLLSRAAPLGETLGAVQLALRWQREHDHPEVARSRSPLARLQGDASLREGGETGQLSELTRLITSPHSRVGRRVRAAFIEAMLEYCEQTSHADVDVDWIAAREHAARLSGLAPLHRRVLVHLAREAPVGVAWDVAALLVADALAPEHVRAAWRRMQGPAVVGRPRVEASEPPADVAARAWGEARLQASLAAWTLAAEVVAAA